jgi:hypothetical protein
MPFALRVEMEIAFSQMGATVQPMGAEVLPWEMSAEEAEHMAMEDGRHTLVVGA